MSSTPLSPKHFSKLKDTPDISMQFRTLQRFQGPFSKTHRHTNTYRRSGKQCQSVPFRLSRFSPWPLEMTPSPPPPPLLMATVTSPVSRYTGLSRPEATSGLRRLHPDELQAGVGSLSVVSRPDASRGTGRAVSDPISPAGPDSQSV